MLNEFSLRDFATSRIRACIFDLDGLLLGTEDLYTFATNVILHKYCRGPLDMDMKIKIMGMPGQKASELLVETYNLPITPQDTLHLTHEILKDKFKTVEAMPGAEEIIKHLKAKRIPIAIATSSSKENFELKKLSHKDMFDMFEDLFVTADDLSSLNLIGKPAPDVYLHALKLLNQSYNLNIETSECLCFEDSVIGIESIIAAGMNPIWIPNQWLLESLPDHILKPLLSKADIYSSLMNVDFAKYGLPIIEHTTDTAKD